MKKFMTMILTLAVISVTPFAVALAQDTQAVCDYSSCLSCMVGENPIKSGLAIAFAVATMIFGFKKKSMPAWVKEIALKLLGGGPAKP